ncbi:UPF0187-domain-containing protein [Marasmius fiardii PR-910]|nr:UPF0187-domain-containing protein [Marasmius fiardii PR-910]
MVASNPLFRKGMSVRRKFAATIVNDIWPEVLFFTSIATMVTVVDKLLGPRLSFPPNLLTVLGTVLALVISFRTSSAYERYQEGRKTWTNIITLSRTMVQLIWIHVPNERPAEEERKMTSLECMIEKKSMTNLVHAISVAAKHYLRGELGVYYEDLYPLICFLPRYNEDSKSVDDLLPLWHTSEDGDRPLNHRKSGSRDRNGDEPVGETETLVGSMEDVDLEGHGTTKKVKRRSRSNFTPERVLPLVPSPRPLKPSRNPPEDTIYNYFPFLKIWKVIRNALRKQDKREEVGSLRNCRGRPVTGRSDGSNIPLEITLYLHRWAVFFNILRNATIQSAVATGFMNTLAGFQDNLSNLERIRNTPLPFAYQAHLRITLWLYLFFLPFQIWSSLGWVTIPATTFTSFLFLGFLEIGQEIENPFNYDLNDLDLDSFCLSIQRELHEITAHLSPEPPEFIFSSWNQPFAPADRRTAEDILSFGKELDSYQNARHSDVQPGLSSLKRTLLQGWKNVDVLTRRN